MAAEDKVGHQEFSQVIHDIPPRQQIEEASAIAENLLEGHQGVGQSLEDPYTCAVHYLEKHRVVEILQNLTSRIAYQRPDNPLQFMLDEIAKVQKGESLEELSSNPSQTAKKSSNEQIPPVPSTN